MKFDCKGISKKTQLGCKEEAGGENSIKDMKIQ